MNFEPLTPDNVKDFPNFSYNEFACHCNGKYCNGFPVSFSYELARILQMVRDHFDSPVVITSPIRCEKWNSIQGGVKNSKHKLGIAVDFYVKGVSYNRLKDYVEDLPFFDWCYNISSSVMHLQIVPPDKDLIIKPVSRDTNKNQLKVLVVNLQVYREPSSSSDKRGYVKTNGIYNYYGTRQNDGYTWYQIDDIQWIPSNGEWLELLPKEDNNINLKEQVEELQKELDMANEQINELNLKIEEQKSQIENLNITINNLEEDLNKFDDIYTCEETGTYKFKIKLYKDESLYIK